MGDLFREVIAKIKIVPNVRKLKERRERLNLSRAEVARRAKITSNYYGDIELGKACSKTVADAITKALEL